MQIVEKPIGEIHPYENNPRYNEEAVKYVVNSIKEFGFKVPLVIDKNGTIVTGHTRYKAAKKLGMKTVPCILADDLTPEQIKAFRIADNKTAEISEWDMDLLQMEVDDLMDSFDMNDFGLDMDFEEVDEQAETAELEEEPESSIYTEKIAIPQYKPTGRIVDLHDCVDTTKEQSLIDEIDESDVPADVKEFLKEAAHRHSVFNYRNIAEYYANAPANVQRLFEKSALVIIDIDDAIANGYVKLTKKIQEIMNSEEDEENEE